MERGLEKQKEKFAAMAVFLFVVIYPLFLLHGYVDVLEAKLLLMKGILIFTFCGIFLLLMTDFCLQKNKKRYLWEKGKIFFKSLSFTDKAILGLSGSFCISFALSQDKNISWTGLEARGNGMLYYMLMFLLYFVISRYYIPGKRERNWWFVSTNILILYALIQFLGFDFLHLFPQNTEGIVTDYLSFLGNTGVFALYITLVLPVALYFSCMIYKKQDTTSEKILFYITFYLCCVGILCANCDAAYLGFAAGYAGTAILIAKDIKATKRFWILTAGACLCIKLTDLLFVLCSETVRNVSWMTDTLLKSPLLGAVAVGSLIIAGLLKEGKSRRYRSIFITLTVLSVLALGGTFLWFSAFDRITPLGKFENYLRFSDNWGTEKGYIFSRLWYVFEEGNIVRKLFGWGPGMTFPVIQEYFWEEMCERFVYIYDDAHSQWLTLLITGGILGCFWMFTALISATCRVLKNGRIPIWGILLLVYLAVSAVSITQPITGPFLWLGLGIAEASINRSVDMTENRVED